MDEKGTIDDDGPPEAAAAAEKSWNIDNGGPSNSNNGSNNNNQQNPNQNANANNEECDRYSFEDSDRFEEDSLCSWSSEPESVCNNWRGWKKPVGTLNTFGGNGNRRISDGGAY